jgi:hypothetical protein
MVEAGEHEIVLRYSTREIKQTLILWSIPISASVVLIVVALWKRRSRSI